MRAEDVAAKEMAPLLNWADEVEVIDAESKQTEASKQAGFVEAHIDGMAKVKIPFSALTEQLEGLNLVDDKKITYGKHHHTS